MEEYKVLITTSGIGSRLGNLTKYTNKSLIRVGSKPVLSYIIEAYPKKIEFVITLGHFGNQVKDFLKLSYPEHKFSFVYIDKFQGPGSSLLYSLSKTESELQTPFIFHAGDTIITEPIPAPQFNWLGGCKSENSPQYRSLSLKDNKVLIINEKGELNYDLAYIGLAGIYDFKDFWLGLKTIYKNFPFDNQLSDVHAINEMKKDFICIQFNQWIDIGNSSSLKKARDMISDDLNVLDKEDEAVFLINGNIIKFFYNTKTVKNRIIRSKILKNCVPHIIDHFDNFYKYKYIEGQLLSKVINENMFIEFLSWLKKNLWHKKKLNPIDFFNKCYDFYINKTTNRIDSFLKKTNQKDEEELINGKRISGALTLLKKINTDWLCSSEPYNFHGDLILENVIKIEKEFKLIDWRQDFSGELKYGDIYYDLGKLNHNLILNHAILNKYLFWVENKESEIYCDVYRSNILCNCQDILSEFVIKNGYNLKKVKIISALIWLNMSPLHSHPLDIFLYYFGRYHLDYILEKEQ